MNDPVYLLQRTHTRYDHNTQLLESRSLLYLVGVCEQVFSFDRRRVFLPSLISRVSGFFELLHAVFVSSIRWYRLNQSKVPFVTSRFIMEPFRYVLFLVFPLDLSVPPYIALTILFRFSSYCPFLFFFFFLFFEWKKVLSWNEGLSGIRGRGCVANRKRRYTDVCFNVAIDIVSFSLRNKFYCYRCLLYLSHFVSSFCELSYHAIYNGCYYRRNNVPTVQTGYVS